MRTTTGEPSVGALRRPERAGWKPRDAAILGFTAGALGGAGGAAAAWQALGPASVLTGSAGGALAATLVAVAILLRGDTLRIPGRAIRAATQHRG